ncbi:hypothetical protein NKJ88_06010 [Mesorhizobium sp. M0016]|uniref:phage major capsid protein n=1 Tax=Mesorhizobium sp. M0016 TaxID=2956843 RepID=UPI00333DE050
MSTKSLTEVRRRGVHELKPLRSANSQESVQAALTLVAEARSFGLGLRDYLDLAIDVPASETPERYRDSEGYLSGYEASLAILGLPVANDFSRGIVLDAASDTFQTYAGTRALFPQVIDDLVRYKYRQDQLENTAALVSQSRTINGIEMVSTVVDDAEGDYQVVRAVAELGRIPVKTIRTGETAVKIYKHGGGYRISYEFQRRARLDMLTPFQNRMARETERSKVWTATGVLINGDGVNPAAGTVAQATLASGTSAGVISWKALMAWLINRAKAGVPVDTVVGNWDAYVAWLMLFAVPTSANNRTDANNLAATGFQIGGVPILQGKVDFALSSAVPANQLIGFSRGDTLEELVEAGSSIDESERAIQNQSITYVKTENTGYKLSFGDTRSIFTFAA